MALSSQVDQVARQTLGRTGSGAVVDQTARQVLGRTGSGAKVDQVARLVLGKQVGTATVDQAVRLILAETFGGSTASCGPIPVFPALPVGFPVKWRPTFKTSVQTSAASGREARWANQSYGLHEIELVFEVLRDQTQNQIQYTPLFNFTEYTQLCQMWLMMYGQFGLFYFDAPWDDSRAGQFIGTGDGTTIEFTVFRTFGTGSIGLTEPVGAVNLMQTIYFNGSPQPSTNYFISGNQIVFNNAPGNGVTITADFSFYYLCRFISDKPDFEEFLKDIWTVKSLKFRSVYFPQVA